MKPVKLKMKGFMTFNKETEIDFSCFDGSGVFLITGDTGSGKSTVFDGIMYALFGEMSTDMRNGVNPVSHFTLEGEDCYVELEFTHRDKTYVIRRNPEYRRKKLRGGGTVKVSSGAVISFDDEKISGNNAVKERVISLLGIDRVQFKQISMLAQGEFTALLRADNKARSLILRKIFETNIYEIFRNKLDELRRGLKKECEDSNSKAVQLLKAVSVDFSENDFDNDFLPYKESIEEIKKWKDNGDADIETILQNAQTVFKQDTRILKIKEKIKTDINENCLKAEGERIIAEKNEELFIRRERLAEEKEKISQLSHLNAQNEEKLKIIERSNRVKDEYDSFKRTQDTLCDVVKGIDENNKNIETLSKRLKKAEEILENEKKKKPMLEEYSAEIIARKQELAKYDELERVREEKQNSQKEKKNADNNLLKYSKALEKFTQEVNEMQAKLEVLKNSEIDLVKAKNEKEKKQKLKEELSVLLSDFKLIEKKRTENKKLEGQYIKSQEEYRKASLEYENAREDFLNAQAGIMAERLTDGEKCPVCGSRQHPEKAVLAEKVPSQEEVNSLEDKKNKKDKMSKEKSVALNAKKGELEGIIGQFSKRVKGICEREGKNPDDYGENAGDMLSIEIKQIEKEIKRTEEKVSKLTEDAAQKNKLEKDEKVKRKRIEDGNDCVKKLEENRTEIEKRLTEITGRLTELEKNLKFETKKQAEDDIKLKEKKRDEIVKAINSAEESYNNAFTEINRQEAVLKKNEENRERLERTLAKCKEGLMLAMKENGFKDDEELMAAFELKSSEQRLRGEVDRYRQRLSENNALIEETNKNLEGRERKNIEELSRKCKMLTEKKNKIESEYLSHYSRCESNKRIIDEADAIIKKLKKIKNDYLETEELYQTANGSLTGKNRISVEEYIQSFYFKKIIFEANKRLNVMTDGQYVLLKKETPTKRSDESFALELEVFDAYTGRERDVSTLSGGESFKAALSLALGLSDVIQQEAGGIEIDALFIDEGFGSLDSDSLEQAISVLYSLSGGNRLVGIISHVNELKEKINKKLVVKKSIEGSRVSVFV